MTIKEQVLALLEERKGESVSGEYIAGRVFASRNAVWKAINALRADGYSIDATTNKGYILSADSDIFSSYSVESRLRGAAEKCAVTAVNSVGSTNTELKRQAEDGAPHGTVLIANEQTAGRGRLGRSFYSPEETGLYMSVILRPRLDMRESLFITTTAAVAVAEAIEAVSGRKTEIKWVNDIYCDGKKVCGILTEASVDYEGGGLNYAVLGIGVNIFRPESGFPDELSDIADNICADRTAGVRASLAAEILNRFFTYYEGISERSFFSEYRRRSMLIGKNVTVVRGNEEITGVAVDVDEEARLVVKRTDGSLYLASSGEVTLKKGGAVK